MIFTPADPLELDTEYAVTVDEGIRDLAGNEMTELPAAVRVRDEPAGRRSSSRTRRTARRGSARPADRAHVLDAHGHRVGRGRRCELAPVRPRAPLERRAARDRPDRAARSRDASTRSHRWRRRRRRRRQLGSRSRSRSGRSPPGSTAEILVPADGVDGIALARRSRSSSTGRSTPTRSDDQLTITPAVAGTLDVVALPATGRPRTARAASCASPRRARCRRTRRSRSSSRPS